MYERDSEIPGQTEWILDPEDQERARGIAQALMWGLEETGERKPIVYYAAVLLVAELIARGLDMPSMIEILRGLPGKEFD